MALAHVERLDHLGLIASLIKDVGLIDKCLFKINFILITKSLDDPFNILNQG